MNAWKKCVRGLVVCGLLGGAAWAVDTDLDGVNDAIDVCCGTPESVPVDESGRPLGDLDLDCDVDLVDVSMLWESYTGHIAAQTPCEGGEDTEDQCLMGTHNCHDNADCIDTSYGFDCVCKEGFAGSGVQCGDINECALNLCGVGGGCTNYVGGYVCACGPGFTDAGGPCVDINECDDEGLCGDAGECVNQPGGYACDCNNGWANCDSQPDCEIPLSQAPNTCQTALFVGQTCADITSTLSCTPTAFDEFTSISGRGSMWIKAQMQECSPCCSDLQHRYTLTVPPGTDYDLYVYSACGGALLDGSDNGEGQTDSVAPVLDDDCGPKINTADVLIEVRHFSGTSCGSWQLTLEGRE